MDNCLLTMINCMIALNLIWRYDMGGNAIKNSRRIYKDEYNSIIVEILQLFPEYRMLPTKTYTDKDSFGDIDFIVATESFSDVKSLVKTRLGDNLEYHDNSMFFSFNYKNVQIDFNMIHPEDFMCMYNYSGDGDLGNFIGRVARSLGFKYGHDGLSYELRLGGHYKRSINVSKDTKTILEFLGYDYDKWRKGFKTKDDIFEYAASSTYFNSRYFSLENQSHNDRTRNRKRVMYQEMIAYIESHNITPLDTLDSHTMIHHYQRAMEIFGSGFHREVLQAIEKYENDVFVSNYINANVIIERTGLSGQKLGKFIAKIKENKLWPDANMLKTLSDDDRVKYVDNLIDECYKN